MGVNMLENYASLRRSPRQTRGERRIETILTAAAELFDEIGFDAATTILIAQRAETAVGSLYDFFPNKEAIASALVAQFSADLHTLLDALITADIATAPLDKTLDKLIDPLVQFINVRPGFRALYLNAPHIGQRSNAQRELEVLFTQRLAALLMVRYPKGDDEVVLRVTRVCMETVKALTALAIETGTVDAAIVADLKTMLRTCVQSAFEPEPPKELRQRD
jgi:AcrR family transcriptional regulator